MSDIKPSYYKTPVPNKSYFEKLRAMVLVSTFPRSGSTLLGYLLTAHCNMVVASEPNNYGENLYDGVPPMALVNYILSVDKMRFEEAKKVQSLEKPNTVPTPGSTTKRTYNKQERYMFVPNQWQASCELLKVVGIKNSSLMAKSLSEEGVYEKFRTRLEKVGIERLKFIFTVRNPYDMISTGIVHCAGNPKTPSFTEKQKYNMITKRIKNQFVERCIIAKKIFRSSYPHQIFINKHEDMVASPVDQLSKLCDFLRVPAFPDYLSDCASVVHEKPNKSRYELDWSEQQKEEVAKLIDQYDFFSGYSWDS